MLNDIVNNFLANYNEDLAKGGYLLLTTEHTPSISVLKMISADYLLTFSFFNELPCRLMLDIESTLFKIDGKTKMKILSEELSFFPFNHYKHATIDTIKQTVYERLGVYETVEATKDKADPYSTCRSLYNILWPNKVFTVTPAMQRLFGGSQAYRMNNYVINISDDGEIFYDTRVYYSFDDEVFTFKNNDNIYSYCGINYIENELELLFFKMIIKHIQDDVLKYTDVDLTNASETIAIKAIKLYKMVKI